MLYLLTKLKKEFKLSAVESRKKIEFTDSSEQVHLTQLLEKGTLENYVIFKE